ncbi:hypothetical protein VP1G_09095 [Cytospora mali]|uniref:Uncharacterized protein n=1 Tax=Cytospora mali TaxID=578113 RepID=A0A194VDI3_CYTMA|nr:hypothetical protein VP1G_09095 [Valsa mali var. pyri (nom. inval.)]
MVTNPSWEDGTEGWTYTYPGTTTDQYSTDGSYSLTFSNLNVLTYNRIQQTLEGLQIGVEYDVSLDFLGVLYHRLTNVVDNILYKH